MEDRAQLALVVSQLVAIPQVRMIRCGVWKPRTRPGGFEGLGEKSLEWISEEKRLHPGARFCCEVARPEHVEACLSWGIDGVWIGARTSGDPFSMNELADSLKGSALPVLIKNPPVPDIKAWMGAIERCQKAGIQDLAAVHRGFDIYGNMGYRNHPLWEVVIELRRLMPDLPILCDPSHIGGRRDLVAPLSQTALDLGLDGLMVEVHPDPDAAKTDAEQQVTPDRFRELLSGLVVRSSADACDAELSRFREQIDMVDSQLLGLLVRRFDMVRSISEVKRRHNMSAYQPKRWSEVLARLVQEAESLGLSAEFVKSLYERIHLESVRLQEEDCKQAES